MHVQAATKDARACVIDVAVHNAGNELRARPPSRSFHGKSPSVRLGMSEPQTRPSADISPPHSRMRALSAGSEARWSVVSCWYVCSPLTSSARQSPTEATCSREPRNNTA